MFILDKGARFVIPQSCHPDEACIASGRKDLGQVGVRQPGAGFLDRAPRALHSLNALTL